MLDTNSIEFPMRVAYLTNQYPFGSHTFIRREIRALECLGVTVDRYSIRDTRTLVVDPDDNDELERTTVLLRPAACLLATLRLALTRPGRFFRAVRANYSLWRKAGGFIRHAAYLGEASLLTKRLHRSVKHLHVHFGTNSAAVALLCGELGGPRYSFTAHGPEEFDRPDAISLALKIASASFVVAISSFGRSQLCRWCPERQWSKIHVVRCGLDEEYLSAEPSHPAEAPMLVCVGRLSEQKGHLLLIQAAKCLSDQGIDFQLTLVGDGELRDELQTLINEQGLAQRISITGWQTGAQVREHLASSRALVLPSFAEGLPVVIMESLALARPVISTFVAGIPELVEPGASGWLVPAGSIEELALAMRQALTTSPAELFEMGLKGRKRVLENHSAHREAQRLARLLAADL